jgi:6-phosphogluconate dehydrogenase
VSARSHPAISERVDANDRLVFRFIAGRAAPRDASIVVRAVAAVGAMARPISSLTHFDVSEHRDLILDAGVSAYNATGKRRRRTVRATGDRKAV